jgi:YidC/Oxa1 family membrane protein insertase
MTDMRRTLLWVVFTMSLVLLWDAWSRHNGQPTLFGGPVPAASAAASGNGVPRPPRRRPRCRAAAAGASAPAAVRSETFTVHTDVMTATFDTLGGTLRRVALNKYQSDVDPKQPMLVLDETGHRYEAQTGYISAAPRRCPPT